MNSLSHTALSPLTSILVQIRAAVGRARDDDDEDAYAALRTLCVDTSAELHRELLAFLETGAHRHEGDLLHALRTSVDSLNQHLQQMRQELDALLPWLALRGEPAARALDLPDTVRLDEIPAVAARLRAELESLPRPDDSTRRLLDAFRSAEVAAVALVGELRALAERAEEEVRGMDFRLLYDRERKLFHIGYNATLDRIDGHYYDLLASEARLASYLAIVKRDVPESHWYALGRPMTSVDGAPALLSWGGTMFEYLMPNLLMRSAEGYAARAGRASSWSRRRSRTASGCGDPWGVSESAYARLDAHQTYQYRSFGVPGLGFKRGLEDDRVVTPYASMLAVSIRPRAVARQPGRARRRWACSGPTGLFEALDRTPGRMPPWPPVRRRAVRTWRTTKACSSSRSATS